jgi:alanine-glyoxylate transaminase/serine-glyoxylate transaminase/serine-pyruvate transaminase
MQHRAPSLTTVLIPEGIDGAAVAKYCLDHFNLEIGNGLGELAGRVWRIGLMGFNARREVVLQVLAALRVALAVQGYKRTARF